MDLFTDFLFEKVVAFLDRGRLYTVFTLCHSLPGHTKTLSRCCLPLFFEDMSEKPNYYLNFCLGVFVLLCQVSGFLGIYKRITYKRERVSTASFYLFVSLVFDGLYRYMCFLVF